MVLQELEAEIEDKESEIAQRNEELAVRSFPSTPCSSVHTKTTRLMVHTAIYQCDSSKKRANRHS